MVAASGERMISGLRALPSRSISSASPSTVIRTATRSGSVKLRYVDEVLGLVDAVRNRANSVARQPPGIILQPAGRGENRRLAETIEHLDELRLPRPVGGELGVDITHDFIGRAHVDANELLGAGRRQGRARYRTGSGECEAPPEQTSVAPAFGSIAPPPTSM